MNIKIIATATVLASVAALSAASAQMYSTGPGFYMSLEGRYLQNSGDRSQSSASSTATTKDADNFSNKPRDDKDLGGKASMGYRFDNNWDIGVSGSGFKSQR